MLSLLKLKRNPNPTLTARLFAAILDCTIIIVVLYPIQQFIFGLIYETAPNQELVRIITSAQGNTTVFSEFFVNLKKNPQFQRFMSEKRYSPILVTQFLQIIALIIYVMFFWIKYQTTPGKMMISAKIVDAKTEKKPTLSQLIIRLLSYPISIIPLLIGFFMIPFNKKRRALHDYIAGTRVISTKNEK